ncbi:MAG TPA: hypothetical protein VGD79_08900, partial [Thermoanaerobaculia bacterium]
MATLELILARLPRDLPGSEPNCAGLELILAALELDLAALELNSARSERGSGGLGEIVAGLRQKLRRTKLRLVSGELGIAGFEQVLPPTDWSAAST